MADSRVGSTGTAAMVDYDLRVNQGAPQRQAADLDDNAPPAEPTNLPPRGAGQTGSVVNVVA